MIFNNVAQLFDVAKILTHERAVNGDLLENGPLLVVDDAGNVVRAF